MEVVLTSVHINNNRERSIMESIRITVNHAVGLHLRPAGKFVKTAKKFESTITVSNATEAGQAVNAKSAVSVLTLGVHQGYEIEISADGPDEIQALEALKTLIEGNFGG